MSGLNLGIDFDGVITDPTELKIAWIHQNCGIELTPAQTAKPEASAIIGMPRYRKMIDQIYAGDWAMRNKIRPEAVQALNELMGLGHRIYIITSRFDDELAKARLLMERHKVPFNGLHNTSEKPKVDVCRRWKIDLFLDDSMSKLAPLREIDRIRLIWFNAMGVSAEHDYEEVDSWHNFVVLIGA